MMFNPNKEPLMDTIVWKGVTKDANKVPTATLLAIVNQPLNRNPANLTGYANYQVASRVLARRPM